MISSIGAFVLGMSQLLFLYIVTQTIRSGETATDKVWEGARGLEWTVVPRLFKSRLSGFYVIKN